MSTATLLLALATVGVDTGWQPVGDDALEYIIQIEPPLLEALKDGEAITSEIPVAVQGVRRYRVVVGESPLPRVGLPAAHGAANGNRQLLLPPPPVDATPRLGLPPPPKATFPSGDQPLPGEPTAGDALLDGGAPRPALQRDPQPAKADAPAARTADLEVPPPLPNGFEPDPQSAELAGRKLAADNAADGLAATDAAALPAGDQAANGGSSTSSADSPKPWLPLMITLLGLFASMGGNVYLGWIAWDSRRHYRALAQQHGV